MPIAPLAILMEIAPIQLVVQMMVKCIVVGEILMAIVLLGLVVKLVLKYMKGRVIMVRICVAQREMKCIVPDVKMEHVLLRPTINVVPESFMFNRVVMILVTHAYLDKHHIVRLGMTRVCAPMLIVVLLVQWFMKALG